MPEVEPSSSGIAVRHYAAAMRELVGDDVWQAALAELPEADRRQIVEATATSWVAMRITSAVTDAVAARIDEDPEELIDRVIRRSTAMSLTTVWRVLLRFTSTTALVARVPTLWARSRNVGVVEVLEAGRGFGKLVVKDWPGRMPQRQARLFAINLETALELTGRRDVRCHWKRTDDGAIYRLSWAR